MKQLFLTIWALVFSLTDAHAMTDQIYGLGGMSSGRVSSVTAETETPYAALLNPALIAAIPEKRFGFSLNWVGARLNNPRDILVDSPQYRTRGGQLRTGTAQVPAVSNTLWSAGFSQPFVIPFLRSNRAGYGFSVSGPIKEFRKWLALSPYDFTNLRYGTSDVQFKGTLGLGLEVIPKYFFIGGSLAVFLTSAGSSEVYLNTKNPLGRMSMDVGFNSAMVLGGYGNFGDTGVSLVYRQSVRPVFLNKFEGQMQVGTVDFANQPATVKSTLYFEPMVLEMDVQHQFERFVLSAGISFQQWSQYEPSYLRVATMRMEPDGAREVSTTPPYTQFRDTWNPRASFEWRGSRHLRVGLGYQFRPTPVVDISTMGNIVDTDVHVVGLATSWAFGPNESYKSLLLTLHGQYHFWAPRKVVKADPDFIGAPGYTITGNAWTAGASISTVF